MRQKELSDYQTSGVECPTCGEIFETIQAVTTHHQHHDSYYYEEIIRQKFNMEPDDFMELQHREKKLPLKQIGEMFGGSEQAAIDICKRWGVETLSLSEAKEAEWRRLDSKGRSERLDIAHETTRELVEQGEHNFQDPDFERVLSEDFKEWQHRKEIPEGLQEWIDNNPKKLREYASRGAEAREENGMGGVTGQDNPSWRGGKSIYDAVKKQLHGRSWKYIRQDAREKDNHTCQMCGKEAQGLDVHHIVPLLSGGTNGMWNLLTLCRSCHMKAESYIEQIPEFDPVLVE